MRFDYYEGTMKSLLVFCLSISLGTLSSSTNSFGSEKNALTEEEATLQIYYEDYKNAVLEAGIATPLLYEQFVQHFEHSYGLTIDSFTQALIDEYTFAGFCYDRQSGQRDSGSLDADYILKDIYGGNSISDPSSPNFDPGIVPSSSFVRTPSYPSFDFSDIQKGDIILETDTIFFGMGHAAIVYEPHKHYQLANGAIGTFIQTIEAVAGGVQFGFLDTERINDYGIMILRPATSASVDDCLDFIYAQLGKAYNYPLQQGRMNTSITSSEWYCSELIYAGYHFAGFTFDHSSNGWINPFDILWSSYVFPTCFSKTPDPVLVSSNLSQRVFKVHNQTGAARDLYFNSVLCFYGDGMSWSNLSNVATISNIPNGLYYYVGIGPNFFGNTAAFSYVINGSRKVSCCNSLNSLNNRFAIHKAIV